MKKLLIFISIAMLAFSACNPNKDIYDALDAVKEPYKQTFEITLTDADYASIKKLALADALTEEDSAMANDIGTYLSFSDERSAALYVPKFLETTYIALDSNSAIKVTYNYAVSEYDKLISYTITSSDFVSMALYDQEFTNTDMPHEYLPEYLQNKFGNIQDTIYQIKAKYTYPDASSVDTVMLYTQGETGWQYIANQYILTSEDYNAMGTPGTNDYFTSSDPASKYMNTFLKLKFPYASTGDEKLIAYNYHTDYTYTAFEAYYFDGSDWTSSKPKTDQFVHNGTQWVFDPTVYYVMQKADYQALVDYVAADAELSAYLDATYPSNTEWYFGASAYYGNIDLRASKRRDNDPEGLYTDMTDQEIFDTALARLGEAAVVVAEALFPDQQPYSNGVEVYYYINFKTYQPGYYYYDVKIKCVDVGQFEYVEGPTEVK